MSTIEVTTRYATSVDDLPTAWAFVMEHVDRVGPDPTVEIKPFWSFSSRSDDEESQGVRKFGVVVEGMVEQGEKA